MTKKTAEENNLTQVNLIATVKCLGLWFLIGLITDLQIVVVNNFSDSVLSS